MREAGLSGSAPSVQLRDAAFFGRIEKKIVCRADCLIARANHESVEPFDTLAEALAQGYAPCPCCRPGAVDISTVRNPLVQSARRYIEAHSAEKFSLSTVAGALFVNGSYLLRTFKAHTGCTLLWYHNFVRCEKVKVLLRAGEVSISEAGELAGFASSAHFSHVFKKMTGLTPSAYREACI